MSSQAKVLCEHCRALWDQKQTLQRQLDQAQADLGRMRERMKDRRGLAEAVCRLMSDLDACSRHPTVDQSANTRLGLSLRDVSLALRQVGVTAEVSGQIVVTGSGKDGQA